MNKQKILTALGATIIQDEHRFLPKGGKDKWGKDGDWQDGFTVSFKGKLISSPQPTELEAWNSVTLDANFCFSQIVPEMALRGIHFTAGLAKSGKIFSVTFTGIKMYGGDGLDIETAILTAFEWCLDSISN